MRWEVRGGGGRCINTYLGLANRRVSGLDNECMNDSMNE